MIAGAQRLRAAYTALDNDQRFAAAAALGLLVAMFLPWYEKSFFQGAPPTKATDTISAFGAVSFVEAAIFLVSVGVLALVLARANGRPFHLPGGDGNVIFGAGLWATALIFYRVFDGPDASGAAGTVGVQWGFLVAFVAAGALAFAGQRIRAAARPEPQSRHAPTDPELDEDAMEFPSPPATDPASEAPTRRQAPPAPGAAGRSSRAVSRDDAKQLTFDDPPEAPPRPDPEIPRARDGG